HCPSAEPRVEAGIRLGLAGVDEVRPVQSAPHWPDEDASQRILAERAPPIHNERARPGGGHQARPQSHVIAIIMRQYTRSPSARARLASEKPAVQSHRSQHIAANIAVMRRVT